MDTAIPRHTLDSFTTIISEMAQVLTINPHLVFPDQRTLSELVSASHFKVMVPGGNDIKQQGSPLANELANELGTASRVAQSESPMNWDQYLEWSNIPIGSPSTASLQIPAGPSRTSVTATPRIDQALPELGTDEWLDWAERQSRQISTPSSSSTPRPPTLVIASPDDQWQTVLTRRADSSFFYCVKSTRIFCRPTCPSRRPVRENVEFVSTPEEATERGYRPCRRCRPTEVLSASEDRQAEMVLRAQELLRTWRERGKKKAPTLQELAEETGMSKFYLLRTFKRIVGKTPEEYAKSL